MTLIKQKQVKDLITNLSEKLNLAGGTMTGAIVLPANPTADLEAATKIYVDSKVASSVNYKGGYNASTNTPDLDVAPTGVKIGDMYTVTDAGTFFTTAVEVGDTLIAEIDDAVAEADWTIVNKNLDDASIKVAYENNADTNAFTDGEQTKVGFVTVTQAVDLDIMESEVATNNAKITNATHTGEVTGDGILTVDKTSITNKTEITAEGGDYVLVSNTSDSGNLKKVKASDFIGADVTVTEEDETCPVTVASTDFDITITNSPTSGIAGIVSISINGVSLSASELISVVSAVITINVPYAVEATDIVTVRYI